MKKALRLIVIFYCLSALLTSCKKELLDTEEDKLESTKNSYQPLTKGSYWKYKSNYPANSTGEQTLTGTTKTFDNKVYHNVKIKHSSFGASEGYFYNQDHTYALRQEVSNFGYINFTYLFDNTTVGATWTAKITDNGTVNGVKGQLKGKTQEIGISKTVNNKVFKNVIHTIIELQYDIAGTYQTFATYDFYIARGVGIIEADADLLGTKTTSTLYDYKIN